MKGEVKVEVALLITKNLYSFYSGLIKTIQGESGVLSSGLRYPEANEVE